MNKEEKKEKMLYKKNFIFYYQNFSQCKSYIATEI